MFIYPSIFVALFFCTMVSGLAAEDSNVIEKDILPHKTNVLSEEFYELEFGSAFNADHNLNDERLGLSLYVSFIQSHILSAQIEYVSLLTGSEFRYDCLEDSFMGVCLFMLGPVISFRETNELVSWIEYQLDFRGGIAYSELETNFNHTSTRRGEVLCYLSVNPGVSFLFKRIGLRGSYFFDVFFFSEKIVLSHAGGVSLFARF